MNIDPRRLLASVPARARSAVLALLGLGAVGGTTVIVIEQARQRPSEVEAARPVEPQPPNDQVRPPVRPTDPPTRPTDPPTRPTDPPTRPTDPPVRPPPVDPPTSGGGWPDDLPFAAPPIPAYAVPTLAECEWTVQGGVYTSTRGLPSQGSPKDAYRASIAAGHTLPITFGVWDSIPNVAVGGLWNPEGPQSITQPDGAGGWAPLRVEFLGLDDSCEIGLSWDPKWGYPAYLAAHKIGLRGAPDSFIIRCNEGVGTLILDGCWWLPHKRPDGSTMYHTSAMHIDKWETLVWRNHRFRGELPTDPGTLVDEHSGYLKSCVGDPVRGGGTWIVGNDLRGGNRTGFQIRPENPNQPRPRGPIVIAYNQAHGYGFTHTENNGGGCLTTWVGPESPVYVFKNRITDARYSALVVSGQSSNLNWLSATGHAIEAVHLWGNTFESLRADRATVSISAVGSVHFWGQDTYDGGKYGDLSLDNTWNVQMNGILNGTVAIHGQEVLDYMLGLDARTYVPGQPGQSKQIPPSQLQSYLVPVAK